MKKFILGLMMIALAGCTSGEDSNLKQKVRDLRESNDTLQSQLNSCQARLDMSGSSSTSNSESNNEPEATPEPQCESTDYQVLTQNGKKLDTCQAESVTETACGIQATDCESGYGYSCLRDVSYKTITKEKCE